MSDLVTGLCSLGGVALGGVLGYATAAITSRRNQAALRKSALWALHHELHFVWESDQSGNWPTVAPFPTDAYQSVKPYLAGLPQYLQNDIANAERAIARWNSRVEFFIHGIHSGTEIGVEKILKDARDLAGSAWGHLERYLGDPPSYDPTGLVPRPFRRLRPRRQPTMGT